MKLIPAAELKRHLSDLLGDVMFKNERFIITRRGRPVAQLSPVEDMPAHLSEVKGWLEDSDPLFPLLESIVSDRQKHLPRVSSL